MVHPNTTVMISNLYSQPKTANFRRGTTGCRPILLGSSTAFHDVTVGRHRCCWRINGHHLLGAAGRCVGFRQPSGFTGGARSERHQTQAPAGDEGKENMDVWYVFRDMRALSYPIRRV